MKTFLMFLLLAYAMAEAQTNKITRTNAVMVLPADVLRVEKQMADEKVRWMDVQKQISAIETKQRDRKRVHLPAAKAGEDVQLQSLNSQQAESRARLLKLQQQDEQLREYHHLPTDVLHPKK